MKLYGFFRGKPLNILEDIGHIFIGLVPMWGWIREVRQLPPETERYPVLTIEPYKDEYWSRIRCEDIFRDNLGYAIGGTIRFGGAIAAGAMLHRWLG